MSKCACRKECVLGLLFRMWKRQLQFFFRNSNKLQFFTAVLLYPQPIIQRLMQVYSDSDHLRSLCAVQRWHMRRWFIVMGPGSGCYVTGLDWGITPDTSPALFTACSSNESSGLVNLFILCLWQQIFPTVMD